MSRNARLAASGGALTALLAVVAVASHAHRPGGATGAGTPHAPTLLFEYVASIAFVLFPLGVVVVLWAASMRRHQRLLEGGQSWRQFLALIAIAALSIPVVFAGRHLLNRGSAGKPANPRSTQPGATTLSRSKSSSHHQAPLQFQWLPALVVASLLLAGGTGLIALLLWRRAHGEEWDREAALAVALDEVLADSLDDLRNEPDARRAVIRAYARMERTFAAYGVPRDDSEAPLEYMARALDHLSVSVYSVRRLTQLFSRAKFSPHEVDAGMKDEAIEALVGLRAELEHAKAAA
jgi:hypothetical protein